MDFDDKDLSLMGRVARRVEELGNPRTRHAEMAQPIVRGSHQYEEENKHVGRLQHLHYSSPMLEELGRGQHFWDMDQHFQRQQRQQLMLYLQPHCLIEEATRMHGHDINLLLSGDCSFVPMTPQLVQYDHALSTTPERSFAESRNIALSWPRLQSSTRLLNPSVSFQSDAAAAATESLTVSENVCHNGAHLVGRNHDVSISTGDSFTIDVPKPSCSQLLKGTKKKSRVNFASLHGQQVSTPSHPSIIGGSLDGPRVAPPIHAYSARAGINEELFPVKLHAILTNPDYHDIIGWHPHGKSWKVFQATLFEEIVSPRFFRQTKFASFMRQVNGWGFQRVCNQDPGEYNSYYHELFVRDDPKKCLKMIRYGGAKNAGGERIIPYGGSKERKVKRMECEDITTIPSSVAGAPGVLVERGQETSEVERACEAKKRSKCSNQSFDDKEESLNKSRKKPLSRRKKRKVITTKPMPAVTARNET